MPLHSFKEISSFFSSLQCFIQPMKTLSTIILTESALKFTQYYSRCNNYRQFFFPSNDSRILFWVLLKLKHFLLTQELNLLLDTISILKYIQLALCWNVSYNVSHIFLNFMYYFLNSDKIKYLKGEKNVTENKLPNHVFLLAIVVQRKQFILIFNT